MKLKTKILIPVVSIIVLLTVSLTVLYNVLMGTSVVKQFSKRGVSVASSLASNGRIGVLLKDSTQLSAIMSSAMTDPEVEYVIFYDSKGEKIARVGADVTAADDQHFVMTKVQEEERSEERRVGKECRL